MGNEKFPQDIIEIINDDGSITLEDVNFKLRKAYMEGLIITIFPFPPTLTRRRIAIKIRLSRRTLMIMLTVSFMKHSRNIKSQMLSKPEQSGWRDKE